MELDARDIVARAIAEEVDEGRGTENGGVYLDISHRDRTFIEERLPRMYERFSDLGVDMSEEAVEVAPTSHYGMGGVRVDEDGETSVDGLYAIGETMAGVHGANRLGGNSLAETVAYGVVTGEAVAGRVDGPGTLPDEVRTAVAEPHLRGLEATANRDGEYETEALMAELRELMWEHAGILRDEESLQAGLDKLDAVRRKAEQMSVGPITSRSFEFAIDLGFMLTGSEAILRSALERAESRGAHYRTDNTKRASAGSATSASSGATSAGWRCRPNRSASRASLFAPRSPRVTNSTTTSSSEHSLVVDQVDDVLATDSELLDLSVVCHVREHPRGL
jgi:succinate dehydrogenase subunit A (EC 1.3.5.1)